MSEQIDYSRFRVERLEEGVVIESFDCGDADLNDFILSEAPLYREALLVTEALASEQC